MYGLMKVKTAREWVHYDDLNLELNEWYETHEQERSPRGKRMPQTPEEFKVMGDLYEKEFMRLKDQVSGLIQANNNLSQRIAFLKASS